jgi:hypothetical protein
VRRLVAAAVASAAVVVAVWPGAASAQEEYPGGEDRQQEVASEIDVHFVVECEVTRVAWDDPIRAPGQPGVWSHLHTFGGNRDVTASSTAHSLFAGESGCRNSVDRSSYWQPTLVDSSGEPIAVGADAGGGEYEYPFRSYYRAGWAASPEDIQPMPFGLRMIAGDPTATTSQDHVGFFCISGSSFQVTDVGPETKSCGGDSFLRTYVNFPTCWDGVNLDSPDHTSHVAYHEDGQCPSTHPVAMPELTEEVSYPAGSTFSGQGFEGGLSQYGLHADFINAWDPGEMAGLVEGCLNVGRECKDVTDELWPASVADSRGTLSLPSRASVAEATGTVSTTTSTTTGTHAQHTTTPSAGSSSASGSGSGSGIGMPWSAALAEWLGMD